MVDRNREFMGGMGVEFKAPQTGDWRETSNPDDELFRGLTPREQELANELLEMLEEYDYVQPVERNTSRSMVENRQFIDQLERETKDFIATADKFERLQSGERMSPGELASFLRKFNLDTSEIKDYSTEEQWDKIYGHVKQQFPQIRLRLGKIQRGLKNRIDAAKTYTSEPVIERPKSRAEAGKQRVRRRSLKFQQMRERQNEQPPATQADVEVAFDGLESGREMNWPKFDINVSKAYAAAKEYVANHEYGNRQPEWFKNLREAIGRPLDYRFLKKSGDVLLFIDEHLLDYENMDYREIVDDGSGPSQRIEDLTAGAIGIPVEVAAKVLSKDQLENLADERVKRDLAEERQKLERKYAA